MRSLKKFIAVVLIFVGVVAATWSLTMIMAPLPTFPKISEADTNLRDGPEVAAARAKLFEAEMSQYRKLEAEDQVKMAARQPYEKLWPVYLVASCMLILIGIWGFNS